MNKKPSISIVLLAFNEIDGLRALHDKILQHPHDEIFAVDGGSTDGTLEFFAEKGIPVVKQKRKGRGAAFQEAAAHSRCDAMLFFSPDGNEDTKDIPRFAEYLAEGNDIVIASRMMKGAWNEEDGSWWRIRKWANKAFNLMANLTWNRGPFVTDSINGYRAIRKDAWKQLGMDETGYPVEYQMTIRAMKAGLKIKEFPTHEHDRIGGESYAKSIPTGLAFLRRYFQEAWLGKSILKPKPLESPA